MTTRNRELASIIDASGNITTGGNLSVAGNLTQTNSTTTSYSDGLLELNSGAGSNSNDLGLVMERGSTGDNAIFLWDESNDGFAVGTTTAVGSATGNISFSAAPFTASTVTGTILTGSTSVKTPLIEYTDGDDAITIADGGHITTGANLSIGGSNNELRFYEGSNYVGFEAPALSADQIWVLPTADGSSGQILKTDGSGNLSFTDDLTLANASVNNFSGNGSATGFTLSTTPVSENATQVYINGVYQFKNTYSVSGTTLTFDAAPPNGSSIEALVWSTVAINTPASASVTNSSLNASVITGQSEVTAVGADHVLIYDASATALKKALVSDFGNTDEEIQDIVGAMFSSNTETGIGVTYQDGDGTLDLVIGDDSIVSSMLDTNIDIAGTLDVTGVLTTDTNATIAGTLGIAGGSSNGVQISQGAIAIKNGGSKSYIDLYCESSNAHYTRIEAAAHSAYSGNVTVTLPVATGTLALTSGSVATVTGAAQSAITSLGTLTTLTVDDITINGSVISDSGVLDITSGSDFTIDSAADITLDAGGGDWRLKDDDATICTISNVSGDLQLLLGTADKDFKFQGTDGSSQITALQLDISDAGKAIFNSGAEFHGLLDNQISHSSTDVTAANSNATLRLGNSAAGNGIYNAIKFSANQQDMYIMSFNNSAQASRRMGFFLGSVAGDAVADERLSIRGDGKVGIGTQSPLAKLTVQGSSASTYTGNGPTPTIRASQGTDGNWIASDVDGKFAYFGVDGNDGKFAAYNYATSTEMSMVLGQNRVRIDNTGRVGINRTPAIANSKLEIGGADDVQLIALEASGYTGGLGIGATGLQFFTDSTVRGKFDQTGEFLVNRTNGFGTGGAAAMFVTGRSDAGIYVTGPNTSGYTLMSFQNGGLNQIGSIKNSNNNATTFNTTSDYRLKENVDYTWDATTRLKQLKPARFNWISDDSNTTVDGFLAHEVSSIVPEAIDGVKDATKTNTNCVLNSEGNLHTAGITEAEWAAGKAETPPRFESDTSWAASHTQDEYQSIDHSKLVPLLVKTIQELEARITTLEG